MSRPSWTTVTPILAGVALVPAWFAHPEGAIPLSLLAVLLVAAVLAAVHHAEVVAHRVGEPYGSLVLAVAVTIIEVGLIDGDGAHCVPSPRRRRSSSGPKARL